MFWHVSVCLSTPGGVPETGPGGRGTSARSTQGGGTQAQVPPVRPGQGVPQWGYTTLGTPIRPGQGGTLNRVPPSELAWGYPDGGYPTSGSPPCRTWLGEGVTLTGEGVPHLVQDNTWSTDTPLSVWLLLSRRRTFLYTDSFAINEWHLLWNSILLIWHRICYCYEISI